MNLFDYYDLVNTIKTDVSSDHKRKEIISIIDFLERLDQLVPLDSLETMYGSIESAVLAEKEENSYQLAHSEGYDEGLVEGKNLGHSEGYDEGLVEGKNLGHRLGYSFGLEAGRKASDARYKAIQTKLLEELEQTTWLAKELEQRLRNE